MLLLSWTICASVTAAVLQSARRRSPPPRIPAARREGRRSREKYYGSLLLDLGAGGLADGINSLQADGGSGERLLEHFVSIRGEGSRAPPMWGLLSLSLETSSCVIYTFFQRSGNRERYAVVIRGVICGLS